MAYHKSKKQSAGFRIAGNGAHRKTAAASARIGDTMVLATVAAQYHRKHDFFSAHGRIYREKLRGRQDTGAISSAEGNQRKRVKRALGRTAPLFPKGCTEIQSSRPSFGR